MKRLPLALMLVGVCCSFSRVYAQQDTSSYFPLGLWGIWINGSSISPWYPNTLSDPQWQKEKENFSGIKSNFLVQWYPYTLVNQMMDYADTAGYRMDVIKSSYGDPTLQETGIPCLIRCLRTFDCNPHRVICACSTTPSTFDTTWKAIADSRITSIRDTWASRSSFYSYNIGHEDDFWGRASSCSIVNDTTHWRGFEYIINRIAQIDQNPNHKSYAVYFGKRAAQANPTIFPTHFPYGLTLTDFANRFPNLDILQVDDYVFWFSVLRNYNNQQAALDGLLISYDDCLEAFKDKTTEWHAIIQSHREFDGIRTNKRFRRPDSLELRVQAYLALSRGAKGITAFVYGSNAADTFGPQPESPIYYPDYPLIGSWQPSAAAVYYDGLVKKHALDDIRVPYTDVNDPEISGIDAYGNMKRLNELLLPLGSTIRKLKIFAAFPRTAVPSGNVANITSVSGDKIEIGTFKRVDEGSDSTVYFMLVNRVCNDMSGNVSASQNVSVGFNHSTSRLITEVVSGKAWVVGANASFSDMLEPGSGKLYRVEPASVSGVKTFSHLRFVGGATLALAANANITARGVMDTVRIALGGGAVFTADTGGAMTVSTADAFSFGTGSILAIKGSMTTTDTLFLNLSSTSDIRFMPGSKLLLGLGGKVISNGKFQAIGTSSNLVTISSSRSTPAPGDWNMLDLRGGPNTLRYCVVEYSQNGAYFRNTSTNLLELSTVRNASSYGVTAFNTSLTAGAVTVRNCNIENNAYGVGIQNGRIDMEQTSSTYGVRNNQYGINIWTGGKLYMNTTYITDNTDWGIYVNGSTAYASLTPNGVLPGYNRVRDNQDGQIWIQTGNAFLGDHDMVCHCGNPEDPPLDRIQLKDDDQDPGDGGLDIACDPPCWTVPVPFGGFNYVSGDYSGNKYWIKNQATPVYAEYTYWGQPQSCPPPTAAFSGTVNRGYCLTGGGYRPIVGVNEDNPPAILADSVAISGYINRLKQEILSGSTDAKRAFRHLLVLAGTGGAFSNHLKMSWRAFLNQVLGRNVPEDLKNIIRAHKLQEMMDAKAFSDAILYAEALGSNTQDDELWFHAKSSAVFAYVASGQLEEATTLFQSINTRGTRVNPDAMAYLQYFLQLQDPGEVIAVVNTPTSINTPVGTGSLASEKSAMTSLEQNRPNPFNPTTQFSYSLAVEGPVTLIVYDILGRQIEILENSFKQAGTYSVTFDASQLSSGLYFYRLQAGSFIAVRKMVVMK